MIAVFASTNTTKSAEIKAIIMHRCCLPIGLKIMVFIWKWSRTRNKRLKQPLIWSDKSCPTYILSKYVNQSAMYKIGLVNVMRDSLTVVIMNNCRVCLSAEMDNKLVSIFAIIFVIRISYILGIDNIILIFVRIHF